MKKISKQDALKLESYIRKAYNFVQKLECEANEDIVMDTEICSRIENMLGSILYVANNSIY